MEQLYRKHEAMHEAEQYAHMIYEGAAQQEMSWVHTVYPITRKGFIISNTFGLSDDRVINKEMIDYFVQRIGEVLADVGRTMKRLSIPAEKQAAAGPLIDKIGQSLKDAQATYSRLLSASEPQDYDASSTMAESKKLTDDIKAIDQYCEEISQLLTEPSQSR